MEAKQCFSSRRNNFFGIQIAKIFELNLPAIEGSNQPMNENM
jgi:hypothetical protein